MTPEQEKALALARARAAAAAAQSQEQPQAAPEMTLGRAGGLTARAGIEGVATGATSLPALANDAIQQGASWIYGGIDKAAALAGYNPGLQESHMRGWGGPFGTLKKMSQASEALADVAGTPKPVTPGEKIAVAGGRELASAVTGVGMGSLLARGTGVAADVGRTLASNPVSQTIAGGVSGAAAEATAQKTDSKVLPLIVGMGAAALVPSSLPGRETIRSQAGREAAAGRIARRATADRNSAIDNLLNADPETPGFRFHASDAAMDPGLASTSTRLREYANQSGGRSTAIVENNNTVLSEALTRHGAAPGTGNRTRAAQRRFDTRNIQDMDMRSLPEIDVTNLINRLEAGTNIRQTGAREAVGTAHQEMLDRLRRGASARYDANGRIIGYTIPPENLHAVRNDFSELRQPGSLTKPNPSSLQHARGETRQYMNDIDALLTQATGGEFSDYLHASRVGRTEADRQEFMENFATAANRGGREGYDPATGARNINAGAWLANTDLDDVPLPGGNPRVSIRDLDPERRAFIEGAREDLNRSGYAARTKRGGGSSTKSNIDMDEAIETEVANSRGPVEKVIQPIAALAGLTANAVGRYAGPIFQPAGRGLQRAGNAMLEGSAERSGNAIREILGRAETDPGYMVDLLRRGPAYNPGFVASTGLALARSGRNAAVEGFMSGERANLREERARRPKRYK